MKHPIRSLFWLTILAGVSLVSPAFAVVNIDWVQVGNPGNGPDPLTGSLYGAVAYGYSIGKYEVTVAQYAEFLNAKAKTTTDAALIWNSNTNGITQGGSDGSYTYAVTAGWELRPVNHVSWFDTARFTNWLGNGQGSGNMNDGAYTLGTLNSGNAIAKNIGATVWLPSENEWYKAAYYDPNKGGVGVGGYWLYPIRNSTITTAHANYDGTAVKDVGTYSLDPNFYGTFDQGGNFWEWNDMAAVAGTPRGLRGGGWSGDVHFLDSSYRSGQTAPSFEDFDFVGFRVASSFAPVPEPSSMLLGLALLTSGLIVRHRGKTSL